MRLLEGVSAQAWDKLIQTLPNAHILQTWEWGNPKSATVGSHTMQSGKMPKGSCKRLHLCSAARLSCCQG